MGDGDIRHILCVSGGKDSAALAIYMRERVPNLEYVFMDTEKELDETYEYLARLEAFLGKPITTIRHDGLGFDHWLLVFGNYLPSARMRWCTKYLKIYPFERYVGDSPAINYVGLRADEDREGLLSSKPNIRSAFPFKDAGLCYSDIVQILEESGVGLPSHYSWRSRSGCYFCFFQQKIEWVGLLENHPDLFEKAIAYEEVDQETGRRFTWCDRESLAELARPERIAAIKADFALRMERTPAKNRSLASVLEYEEDPSLRPCLICHL